MNAERKVLYGIWIAILLGSMARAAWQNDIGLVMIVGIISIIGATILALVKLVAGGR